MKLVSMMNAEIDTIGVGCHWATPYLRKASVVAKQPPYQKTGTMPVTPDTTFTQTHTPACDTAFTHSHSQSMTPAIPISQTSH